VSIFCPSWVYSATCALTAQRYLGESLGLEAFASKYASVLADRYSDISYEMVLDTSESYLRQMMDAGVEDASEILESYAYNRITFDKNGAPRKIKGFFSSSLDGLKTPDVSAESAAKEFKPFIYMYRTKPELAMPAGWTWGAIEDGEWLKEMPELEVSFLDGI